MSTAGLEEVVEKGERTFVLSVTVLITTQGLGPGQLSTQKISETKSVEYLLTYIHLNKITLITFCLNFKVSVSGQIQGV